MIIARLSIVVFIVLGGVNCSMKEKDTSKSVVSAQVLLKSHSGQVITETTVVTSQNIDDYQPADGAVESATRAFKNAGFEISDVVGNNFAITAPAEVFEREFHAKLRLSDSGEVNVKSTTPPENEKDKKVDRYKLPLGKAKESLIQHVQHVTFTAQPDFGPEAFH